MGAQRRLRSLGDLWFYRSRREETELSEIQVQFYWRCIREFTTAFVAGSCYLAEIYIGLCTLRGILLKMSTGKNLEATVCQISSSFRAPPPLFHRRAIVTIIIGKNVLKSNIIRNVSLVFQNFSNAYWKRLRVLCSRERKMAPENGERAFRWPIPECSGPGTPYRFDPVASVGQHTHKHNENGPESLHPRFRRWYRALLLGVPAATEGKGEREKGAPKGALKFLIFWGFGWESIVVCFKVVLLFGDIWIYMNSNEAKKF